MTTRRDGCVLKISIATATLVSGACFAQSPTFSVQVLHNISSQESLDQSPLVYGINNAGEAVGVVGGASVCERGCPAIWHDGIPTPLDLLPGTIGGQALGINDSGQIIGSMIVNNLVWVGVIWTNGTPTVLPGPDSQRVTTYPTALNDAGQVTGIATTWDGYDEEPIVWNGLTPTVLGPAPDCPTSQPAGINDNGLIVGGTTCTPGDNPDGAGAVVWRGTTAALLPSVKSSQAAPDSIALAVNSAGLIVGTAINAAGAFHAAAWANRVLTDLGTLKTGIVSSATAVNSQGIIVGDSATLSNVGQHAALWSHNGGAPFDLNALISTADAEAFELVEATGINDSCAIVVNGFHRKTNAVEAFLLTLTDPSQCVAGMQVHAAR
jgi:probable HAF family extracellular repeat protein